MKNEKLKIAFLIIGSFLLEYGIFSLTNAIVSFFSFNDYLTSIIFFIITTINYFIILPKISLKISSKTNIIFCLFLILNIVFNGITIIGAFIYLTFITVNPNYMSLVFLDVSTGMFALLYIILTFAKPFILKLALNTIYKQ